MLPSTMLRRMRAINNRAMPSSAVISRGGAPLSPVPTMPDGSPLRCRVRTNKEMPIVDAAATEEHRRWEIYFPDAVPVQVGDHIATLGSVYGVVELTSPTSYSVATGVYAYMLYDTAGTPVYIRPNAQVTIKRVASTVVSALPVRIFAPTVEQVTAIGGLIRYTVVTTPTTLLRTNDLLYVTSCPNNPDLVAMSTTGWQITALRDTADTFPTLVFTAQRPDQP